MTKAQKAALYAAEGDIGRILSRLSSETISVKDKLIVGDEVLAHEVEKEMDNARYSLQRAMDFINLTRG